VLAVAQPHALAAQGEDSVGVLLARGDTTGAIAAYEQLIRSRSHDAELHYRVGLLYMSRVEPGTDVSADRRRALEHLQLATRFAADSAKYWLAFAEALRTETDVTARAKADQAFQRAVEVARRVGSSELAKVEYRAGRMAWERFEQANERHVLVDGSTDIDQTAFLTNWRYVQDLLRRRLRLDYRGLVEWRVASDHLEAAVRADSSLIPAAGLLVVALCERGAWDSAVAVTGRLVRADPDSESAWALNALALSKAGHWAAAATAFDSAERRRPNSEPSYAQVLDSLLAAPENGEATDSAAHQRTARFWRDADPLWSTPENEARLEALARVVYADHRWTDDLRGHRGALSHRGAVFVRYGPPDVVVSLGSGGAEGTPGPGPTVVVNPVDDDWQQPRPDAAERLDRERIRLLWIYEQSRRRFIFGLTPGYARAVFGGDAANAFAQAVRTTPLAFDDLRPDSLEIAVYAFRGDSVGRAEVGIYGLPPARSRGSDTSLAYAAFVTTDTVVDPVRADAERNGSTRRWRTEASPGAHTVRVEATDSSAARGLRGTRPISVRPFGAGFQASDLIVATGELSNTTAERWYDAPVTPVIDPVRAGTPVTLLWELYDPPEADGTATYTVTVRLTAVSVARRGLVARIIGGVADALGVSAEGDDVIVLQYERRRSAGSVATEYVTLDLGDTSPGRYRVEVEAVTPEGKRATAAGEFSIVGGSGR
jgi:GWxTD domain-containing protein